MKEYLLIVWKEYDTAIKQCGLPPVREEIIFCTHFSVWDELDKYKDRKITIYEVGNCVLDWS